MTQLQRYKESVETLEDSLCGLQTAYTEAKQLLSERESMLSTLEQENTVLREDLLKLQEGYREKCEELRRRNEASKCVYMSVCVCLSVYLCVCLCVGGVQGKV